jgi:hypothetical protein
MRLGVGLRNPESARRIFTLRSLISLQQAFAGHAPYDCIIAHNLSDLFDTRTVPGPRMLIIHLTLEGMILEQNAQTPVVEYRNAVAEYTERVGAHVVAVSSLKGKSWGFTEHIVPLTANPAEYLPWTGELACGPRVSNFVLRRARTLRWDFHGQAFAGLPITLVGHNPEFPGVRASSSWAELKDTFRRHRFFVHTAEPELEDGYNMEMGRAGRQTVPDKFSGAALRDGMLREMRAASDKWQRTRQTEFAQAP